MDIEMTASTVADGGNEEIIVDNDIYNENNIVSQADLLSARLKKVREGISASIREDIAKSVRKNQISRRAVMAIVERWSKEQPAYWSECQEDITEMFAEISRDAVDTFKAVKAELRKKDHFGEVDYNSPHEVITHFLNLYKVEINTNQEVRADESLFGVLPTLAPRNRIEFTLLRNAWDAYQVFWGLSFPYPREALEGIYETMLNERIKAYRDGMRDKICKPLNEDERAKACAEMDRFIGAITADDLDLSRAVIQQIIWLVKKRMIAPEANGYDLMMILSGEKQGSGKSTAIDKFNSPLGSMYMKDKDFKIFNDLDRNASIFTNNCVNCFHEMSFASRADIDNIKERITARTLTYRVMYSQRQETKPQLAVFMGTANRDISDLIYDTTGMRRFYQINARDVIDWDVINDIDYELIWRSVEYGSIGEPIVPFKAQLAIIQEETRAKSVEEQFLLDVHGGWGRREYDEHAGEVNVKALKDDGYIRAGDLWDMFIEKYVKEGNIKYTLSAHKFYKAISHIVSSGRYSWLNKKSYADRQYYLVRGTPLPLTPAEKIEAIRDEPPVEPSKDAKKRERIIALGGKFNG